MRLPRMTTRRWMAYVAFIALLTGGAVGGHRVLKRSQHCRSRLLFHGARYAEWNDAEWRDWALIRDCENSLTRQEGENPSVASICAAHEHTVGRLVQLREKRAADARRTADHSAMARKYADAAHSLWLLVEPDPPKPDNPFDIEESLTMPVDAAPHAGRNSPATTIHRPGTSVP